MTLCKWGLFVSISSKFPKVYMHFIWDLEPARATNRKEIIMSPHVRNQDMVQNMHQGKFSLFNAEVLGELRNLSIATCTAEL